MAKPHPDKPTPDDIKLYLSGLRLDDQSKLYDWERRVYIAKGAYGCVYKVVRRLDKKKFAMKVISRAKLTSRKRWRQLIHEVEILSRINHPHCVQLEDTFYTHNDVIIVLELVEGGQLDSVQGLTEKDVAKIAAELIEAMRYLHEEIGIVHRDLKPGNILLTPKARHVKVVDFGFAKFVGRRIVEYPGLNKVRKVVTLENSYVRRKLKHLELIMLITHPAQVAGEGCTTVQPLTLDDMRKAVATPTSLEAASWPTTTHLPNTPNKLMNSPKGTIEYLAPEILENIKAKNTSPRVTTRENVKKLDMFAIGCIIYWLLCGSNPFMFNKCDREYYEKASTLYDQVENACSRLFKEVQWKFYSPTAHQFVAPLLASLSERPSAKQALGHPWLLSREVPTQSPSTPIPTPDCALSPVMYQAVKKKEDPKMPKLSSPKNITETREVSFVIPDIPIGTMMPLPPTSTLAPLKVSPAVVEALSKMPTSVAPSILIKDGGDVKVADKPKTITLMMPLPIPPKNPKQQSNPSA